MHNELFSIGPITIYGYGLMIAIGILFAYFILFFLTKKKTDWYTICRFYILQQSYILCRRYFFCCCLSSDLQLYRKSWYGISFRWRTDIHWWAHRRNTLFFDDIFIFPKEIYHPSVSGDFHFIRHNYTKPFFYSSSFSFAFICCWKRILCITWVFT